MMIDPAKLDDLVSQHIKKCRVPGAAIAIVNGGEVVFERGYGLRDVERALPMSAATSYPIASTTKAMNATLIAMLVDEKRLDWDAPVQTYLPRFGLSDQSLDRQVTLRDLVAMRTGLPRHDWVWFGSSVTRTELVDRLHHLPLSAGFREKFIYNNLTTAVAGHIAEVVTGEGWEDLVRQRILEPLGMCNTRFSRPDIGEFTQSYHETIFRQLTPTQWLEARSIAPAGGAIQSTVQDMARWARFNLQDTADDQSRLLTPAMRKMLHSPCVVVGDEISGLDPNATYALGWFVDIYNGRPRVSHGGYLHDVNSSVILFPADDIGIVSFINFGAPRIARLLNEHIFDTLRGVEPITSIDAAMADHEKTIGQALLQKANGVHRAGTGPSHSLDEYAGAYAHPGYGEILITHADGYLRLQRGEIEVALDHRHFDVFEVRQHDLFEVDAEHPFDAPSRIAFDANFDGEIDVLRISLESKVLPLAFQKRRPVLGR